MERPEAWRYEAAFDGGDAGCVELLMDLRSFFRAVSPGATVAVIARDAGAPVEMPAWCRMIGHALIDSAHPHYLVQTRSN